MLEEIYQVLNCWSFGLVDEECPGIESITKLKEEIMPGNRRTQTGGQMIEALRVSLDGSI